MEEGLFETTDKLLTTNEASRKRKKHDNTHDQDARKDDQMYFRSYADIGIHEEMLADRVRTTTYRLAILKNFEAIRGKVVLDIGAGTGILSMFCVQAGAKKVYAIEASEMANQAKLVFSSNHVADKVTVLHGKVEDVDVPEKVDVIVSEWMGYFLLYETMLPSVLFARDKWLNKGGLLLPGKASLFMAPITDPDYTDRLGFWDDIEDQYGVKMSCLKPYAARCHQSHVHIQQGEPQDIMAHAARITTLDLHEISKDSSKNVKGQFQFDCFGEETIHGFCVWFDVYFNRDITLSTSPYQPPTHWQQSVLYISEPVSVQQGTIISGSLTLKPNSKYHRFLDISLEYKVGDHEEKTELYLMDDFIS